MSPREGKANRTAITLMHTPVQRMNRVILIRTRRCVLPAWAMADSLPSSRAFLAFCRNVCHHLRRPSLSRPWTCCSIWRRRTRSWNTTLKPYAKKKIPTSSCTRTYASPLTAWKKRLLKYNPRRVDATNSKTMSNAQRAMKVMRWRLESRLDASDRICSDARQNRAMRAVVINEKGSVKVVKTWEGKRGSTCVLQTGSMQT
mmetsp:Transcript_14892/g.47468  ORF Transcript_14892/g.47468 Transcript_14892/m.47468 type:complete len:201 (-) Transcript_14892:648-1250(-)